MTAIISTLPTARTTAAVARQAHADGVATLVAFARAFQQQAAYRRGIAGAEIVGAIRRIEVELGGVGGEVAEARYDQFKPTAGTGVLLMRSRVMGASEWLILGQVSGTALPCFPADEVA